jgi:hypothetical protein
MVSASAQLSLSATTWEIWPAGDFPLLAYIRQSADGYCAAFDNFRDGHHHAPDCSDLGNGIIVNAIRLRMLFMIIAYVKQ